MCEEGDGNIVCNNDRPALSLLYVSQSCCNLVAIWLMDPLMVILSRMIRVDEKDDELLIEPGQ